MFNMNWTEVEGWLGPVEGNTLFNYAKEKRRGVIVDIGTYKGKSAICMASALKQIGRGKVYTIDEKEYEGFKENIKKSGVEDYVVQIIGKSSEIKWDKPIKLLFIDGSHEYANVKADFEHFSPFIVKGGVVVFHDSDNDEYPDVRRFLFDYLLEKCPVCDHIKTACFPYKIDRELGNMLCLRKV
jgi:predicted O-methyltransferase YrrM